MSPNSEQMAALYGAWDAWAYGEMRDRKTVSWGGLSAIYECEFWKHMGLRQNGMAASYILTGNHDGMNGEDRKLDPSNGIPIAVAYNTGYDFGLEKWNLVKEMSRLSEHL
jgi:hypothetical protein